MRLPGVSLPIVNDPRSRSAEAKLRLLPHTSGSVVDPGRDFPYGQEQASAPELDELLLVELSAKSAETPPL